MIGNLLFAHAIIPKSQHTRLCIAQSAVELRVTDYAFLAALATKWARHALQMESPIVVNVSDVVYIAKVALAESQHHSVAVKRHIGQTTLILFIQGNVCFRIKRLNLVEHITDNVVVPFGQSLSVTIKCAVPQLILVGVKLYFQWHIHVIFHK